MLLKPGDKQSSKHSALSTDTMSQRWVKTSMAVRDTTQHLGAVAIQIMALVAVSDELLLQREISCSMCSHGEVIAIEVLMMSLVAGQERSGTSSVLLQLTFLSAAHCAKKLTGSTPLQLRRL